MYITYEQMVSLMGLLQKTFDATPSYRFIEKFRASIMLGMAIGMVRWMEDRGQIEEQQRCAGCGEIHGPSSDPRSN